MPAFRLSNKARDDIRSIGRYTQKKWGKPQRRKYLDGMNACFARLAENPALAPERPDYSPPVRMFPYERHVIIYISDKRGILIVRVLHENMDLPAHLAET